MLGGDIYVQSEKGKGTTFRFHLFLGVKGEVENPSQREGETDGSSGKKEIGEMNGKLERDTEPLMASPEPPHSPSVKRTKQEKTLVDELAESEGLLLAVAVETLEVLSLTLSDCVTH